MNTPTERSVPVNDVIITAVAQLVDDAQCERRDPSHSDIEFLIQRACLTGGDPNTQPGRSPVGKAKRVRGVLSWALEHDVEAGEQFIGSLIAQVRGHGGFREGSPNYVGAETIKNAAAAFRAEGYELTLDGDVHPILLDNLSGVELTAALEAYVRRAKRGADDVALLTGTGKDLLEATAAHVLRERWSGDSAHENFPTLLGQAFTAVGMATPQQPQRPSEPPQRRVERAMYELGCAINGLRNKQGTGHGRPWLPTVTDAEAKATVEFMGILSERLLSAHKSRPF